jgi:hypothetical protein
VKALGSLIFATVLSAQPELPKDVIQLSQIRREIGKSLDMLNNYTCVEPSSGRSARARASASNTSTP